MCVRWIQGLSRKRQKPEMQVDGTSINQIKFTNCQLYQETAGLEVKYNRLIFGSGTHLDAIRRCFEFTKKCSAMKLQWLRQVLIVRT